MLGGHLQSNSDADREFVSRSREYASVFPMPKPEHRLGNTLEIRAVNNSCDCGALEIRDLHLITLLLRGRHTVEHPQPVWIEPVTAVVSL